MSSRERVAARPAAPVHYHVFLSHNSQDKGSVEPLAVTWIMGTVRLEMIQLARSESRHKDAPDIPPAGGVRVKVDDLGRFALINAIIKQQPHRRGGSAEDVKLDASVVH